MSAAALKEAVTSDSTAVAKKPEPKNFPAMLETWKGEIARALPRHLNADRMARIALTCFRNVPKLGECDPRSVFAAVLQAAQLGIEPGLMGEAHIVPFKDQAQLIPGYQGLIKLAKQTGQVVDIYAMAVREHDRFRCTFGLNRTLEHEPKAGKAGFPASDSERGEIVGFYAVAVFKDGTRTFVAMGRDAVDKIRDNSRGYQMAKKWKKETPWDTHFEEMGAKTAIRRLCKTLPKSPELATALALEDAHYRGQAQNIKLDEAIENSYSPPVTDGEPVDIDPSTGEVLDKSQPAGAQPPAPSSSSQAAGEAPRPAASRQRNDGGPSIKDALKKVNDADYDGARDMVRGSGFTDIDRAEIESAVKRHKQGERV
jgi:recombination protein RecT